LLRFGLNSLSRLRHNRVSRRSFLAAASLFTACSRKGAPRYRGWLFVASAAEKAIVVADLSAFRSSGSIPLGAAPGQVLSARGKLFAACPDDRTVLQIDPVQRTITGKIPVNGKITGSALNAGSTCLAVATSQPHAIVLIDTNTGRIVARTSLPQAPNILAVGGLQAAAILQSGQLARVSIPGGELLGLSDIGAGSVSTLGYRKDGQTIFAAARDARQIVSLDAASGSVLTRLPVSIRPARFCASGDGGQVFVTGADPDGQLVIFSPYQNQVDQTLYAGHALFGMAVAPIRNLLFLTNPDAGDVTILDIESRRIVASIRTGGHPREILVASSPDSATQEEYAFAVDGDSGDVSVIHIPAVQHKTGDAIIAEPPKPVFAVFHTGAAPQSAVIVPYTA